jgi:hypothetical protein
MAPNIFPVFAQFLWPNKRFFFWIFDLIGIEGKSMALKGEQIGMMMSTEAMGHYERESQTLLNAIRRQRRKEGGEKKSDKIGQEIGQ